jgi:hypothetical protein
MTSLCWTSTCICSWRCHLACLRPGILLAPPLRPRGQSDSDLSIHWLGATLSPRRQASRSVHGFVCGYWRVTTYCIRSCSLDLAHSATNRFSFAHPDSPSSWNLSRALWVFAESAHYLSEDHIAMQTSRCGASSDRDSSLTCLNYYFGFHRSLKSPQC